MKRLVSKIFRPFRNWRRQRFYKKKFGKCTKDVVILSNDCLAGITYHDANRPFLSPTINLTVVNDFLTFAKYFDFYCGQKLESVMNPIECPRGILRGNEKLPDIQIKFTHYKTFEESENKWNKRVKRATKEFPLYIIYTTERITNDEINIIRSINFAKLICLHKNECNFIVPNVVFVKIPDSYKNKDITSFKSLLSRKRFFDDFVDLYSLIYATDD